MSRTNNNWRDVNWIILDEKTILEALTEEQRISVATDFATLLGTFINIDEEGKTFTDYWVSSIYSPYRREVCIGGYYSTRGLHPSIRTASTRPALLFSDMLKINPSAAQSELGKSFESNLEYPQKAVSAELNQELEAVYNNLKRTGKTYTVDSIASYLDTPFDPRELAEVEYKGKKYVRVQASLNGKREKSAFTDGEYYFVEVQKIRFIKIRDNIGREYALAEQPLFAGVQFDLYNGFYEDNYTEREKINSSRYNIGRYLNKYFAKDIIPSQILETAIQAKYLELYKTDKITIGEIPGEMFSESFSRKIVETTSKKFKEQINNGKIKTAEELLKLKENVIGVLSEKTTEYKKIQVRNTVSKEDFSGEGGEHE